MRLSKEQIQFIEDYLKRNKAKYGDVRMELLDHIANAVKEKMNNGRAFDDAMVEVYLSFGNKRTSKKLNKDNTQWIITESIYADNSGYKKLIAQKQQELQKGIRKKLRKFIISFFKNPVTLMLYLFIIFGLFRIQYVFTDAKVFFKGVYIILICLVAIPLFISGLTLKKPFKTLYMGSSSLPFLSISILNFFTYLPMLFIEESNKGLSQMHINLVFIVLFPLMVSEIKLFLAESKRIRIIQKRFL